MADLRFTVDYSQVKEANKEILKVGSNAQKSASVFEAAFKKAEVQSGRSARAVREQIAFSERLERQKTREANAVAAGAARVAAEEERLRRKYVEGYAAMDVYSKELNDIAIARKADIISAEQQRQAVERLNQQMAAGTGVFSAYGAATKGNVKGTNNLGVMMQQTGYQVGDFAVQVQSGTNVAVAFGQQATQLVGALYLLPAPLLAAKVGILGLSISVTALIASFSIILPIVTGVVAYFMRAAEASRNTKEKVSEFENALSSARGELQGMREDLRLLQSGLESAFILTFSDEVDQAKKALSEARAELDALYNQNVAVGESLANVTNLDDYEESVRLARERLANATLELSTAQEMARQERQRTRDESVVKQLLEARIILREQEAAAVKETTDRLNEMALAERSIGRGRGLSAGPSAQEIQTNVIAAQLAATGAAERARLRALANGSGAGSSRAAISDLQREIDKLNKTASQGLTPFDKYNKAIEHLNKLRSKGLSDSAYSMEIERLNEELAKSLPMVDDVANAFGDFLARGLTDFKSFADAIFKSFQNMLAQMIATAARNRILISLGATGSMAGPASAAGNLAQGAGMLGGVGTFASSIGTGLSVVGNGFMAGGFGGAATASMGAISGGIGMGGAAGFGTALGAAIPVLGAVALAVGLFRTKTKELDSGLNVTVGNMDALVESFKTVEKSRFFGLSKKTSTSSGMASSAIADPIVAAVQQIQQSVLTGAETLGVGAKVFEDFTYRLNLSLKGLTEEQKLQKLNEELSKMGDAFASLIPNVQNMAQLTAILDERYSLETRLLQIQGNTQALRERELATVNEYNRSILEQIFAAEDAAAATNSLNVALSSLSENNFATLLDFNRAQAAIRMGLPVANTPDSVSMPSVTSGPTSSTGSSGTSSEVAKLRQDMKEMHKEVMFAYSKLIKNSKDSRDTLRGWDIVGIPPERTA